ncbi:MAG: MFS transporter [Acidimicrobiia bacterium]
MSDRRGLFAPFRSPRYSAVWSGAFVSNIGTWMETLTIGVYITDVTKQAAWTGVIAAAGFVPNAVFAPLGGALADRISRRALLIFTNTAQACVAATLALLIGTSHPKPILITALVFIGSSVGSMGFPAYMSVLPDLVEREDIPAAVALSSTQWNLGRVVGPAIAGFTLKRFGYSTALWVNAFSFIGPIVAMMLIALPSRVAAVRESVFESMKSGFRFARHDPAVWVALRILMITAFFGAPFIALIPAVAHLMLGGGKDAAGWLTAGQGVGAVIAAVVLGVARRRYGASSTLLGAFAIFIASLIAYALSPNVAFASAALVLVGGSYLAAFASLTTTAQLRAAPELRGRTLATFMIVLGVLFPIGALIQGKLGDLIGLRWVTAGSGVFFGLVLAVVLIRKPDFMAPLNDAHGDSNHGSDYS